MIRPGMCSVTLAKRSPRDVLQTVVEAGLQGIEWWGRDHVPHWDVEVVRRVGAQTRAVGIEVACYGSYYRSGVSEAEGLAFASVLDTAVALGAPMIRIWAGSQNGIEADAVVAALAKSHKAELVTGAPEFKQVENEIRIHWLKTGE